MKRLLLLGFVLLLMTGFASASYINTQSKINTFTFNYSQITGQGKPTLANRGVAYGFSLPVYNSDDEELFSCRCIPSDWNGRDVVGLVGGWLPSANNAKKFNLEIAWESWNPSSNDVIPEVTNLVTVETTTGNDSAYTSHIISFPIPISSGTNSPGDIFAFRVRRLAASGDEITGEFVVEGAAIQYTADYNVAR